jgi:hypothetical protein
MKKIIITVSLSILMIATTFAQKEKMRERGDDNEKQKYPSKNCEIKPALKITSAAYDLIESYKKLLNPSVLCKGSTGTPTSFGKMTATYFGNNGPVAGQLTFSSFIENDNLLRTIWGTDPGNYTFYGACPPPVIVYPNPPASANHVYAAKLVTIPNFVAAGVNAAFLNVTALNIADIKSFDCIKLEEANGYAAATEAVTYNDVFSSKGIMIAVTLNTGVQQWCYIINNYDTAGTLKWKE